MHHQDPKVLSVVSRLPTAMLALLMSDWHSNSRKRNVAVAYEQSRWLCSTEHTCSSVLSVTTDAQLVVKRCMSCYMQVFQRQMSKEGLQAVVNGSDAAGGGWSSEMLRDLFTLREDTASDTYDSRCRPEDDNMEEGSQAELLEAPQYKQQAS